MVGPDPHRIHLKVAGPGRFARPMRKEQLLSSVAALLGGVLALFPSGEALGAPTDPRIIARYQQMLAANPVEGSTLERLWAVAEKDGLKEKLLQEAKEKAIAGDFGSQMVYGLFLARSGERAAAKAAFEEAAGREPTSPLPHQALAHLAESAQEKAAALEVAAALFESRKESEKVALLTELGNQWLAAGDFEKASAAWERIAAISPDSLELRSRLAALYQEHGFSRQAMPHFQVIAAKGAPEARVEALRALSTLALQAGEVEAALEHLDTALSLVASGNWLRRELLAQIIQISQEHHRVEALEKRWQAAAETAPRSPDRWLALADLYASEGANEKESGALEKASLLLPGDVALHRRWAQSLARGAHWQAAAAIYDRLLETRPGTDLIFERAEIDVQLGEVVQAQRRVAQWEKERGDGAVSAQALEFFTRHRMDIAREEQLRRPGGDPVALAEFLFSQRRSAEARDLLRGMAGSFPKGVKRAEAYQRAAEVLREAGETAAADEAMQSAVAAQPESRTLQMALGDFVLERSPAVARRAYAEAYRLSQTSAEKVEADQRLYNACTRREPEPAKKEGSLASRMFKASEGVPTFGGPSPVPQPPPPKALGEQLAALEKALEADAGADAALRLARWRLWSQDPAGAMGAVAEAQARDPRSREAVELRISLFLAEGRRLEAVDEYRRLIEIAPGEKTRWLKEIAQLRFALAQPDEALAILQELAAGGDASAVADLALGQQRANRWIDALATWESLYNGAKAGKRAELLQPLVQAHLRLGHRERAREVLWLAFIEQQEEGVREAVLKDLLQLCHKEEALPWLISKLQARVEERSPQVAWERLALARALKAAGQGDKAVREMETATLQTRDRAATEEALVAEAEANRDFALAARHQKRRLAFLKAAVATEWERLATFQEQAGEDAAAEATRDEIVRRFPRDSEALLLSARAYDRWGRSEKSHAIYQAIHLFEPLNLEAAAALLPDGDGPLTAEAIDAAETILKQSDPDISQPIILPPIVPALENRLNAYLTTAGKGVVLYNQQAGANVLWEWRLMAIRALARNALATGNVAPWVARWQGEGALPAEKLWALSFAEAGTFDYLRELAGKEGTGKQRGALRCAFLWNALYDEEWEKLGQWLWKPERTMEEFDAFKGLLGEWARLQRPVDLGALFKGASPAYLWPCAQVLAEAQRYPQAVELGWRVFGSDPGTLRYRGADGLQLVDWLLTQRVAQGEPMLDRALALLREIANEPADTLEAPAFEAQRLLYELLPPTERQAWVRGMLASTGKPGSGAGPSPVFKALTESLLRVLAAEPGDARSQRAVREALQQLVALRASVFDEMPVSERVWKFLLDTGTRFIRWRHDEAAIMLWEMALEDKVDITLQGSRVSGMAAELQVRLLALRLSRLGRDEFRVELEEAANDLAPRNLPLLATHLEAAGCLHGVAEIYNRLYAVDPHFPLNRVILASRAARDPAIAEAAMERWKERGKDRRGLALIIEALAESSPGEAKALALEAAESFPDDLGVLEQLSALQVKMEEWNAAEMTGRRLLVLRPNCINCRLRLADVLAAQGRPEEALKILRQAPERAPLLDRKAAAMEIRLGREVETHALFTEAIRTADTSIFQELTQNLKDAGKPEKAAELLIKGVDASVAARKPRAAFTLQLELLKLLGPESDATERARQLQKLRALAGGRQEFLSAYFELTEEPRWQSRDARQRELEETWDEGKGSTVGGAWLAAAMLDAGQYAVTADFLNRFLKRTDIEEPLLTWLDDKSRAAGRFELSFILTDALLRRGPDKSDNVRRRVRTLRAMNRLAEARALLERAEGKSLLQPIYGERLAPEAAALNEPLLARRMFERVLASLSRGQRSNAAIEYARLLLSLSDYPTCRHVLRQHIRTQALDAAALKIIAEYLRSCGHPVESEMEELELRLQPEQEKMLRTFLVGTSAKEDSKEG